MLIGRASNIFDIYNKTIISKLKSYKGQIINIARDSFNPIEVGEALWQSVALESSLHAAEVTNLSLKDLAILDSIQANFGVGMLGVRIGSSHAAILKELGWMSISTIIMKRKLQYWARLCTLSKSNWAYKAPMENMEGSWNSSYKKRNCPFPDNLQPGEYNGT